MTTTNENVTVAENALLCMGMLIAEMKDGTYQPISTVSEVSEARFMAAGYLQTAEVTPVAFAVWSQGANGYKKVATLPA